MDSGQGGGATAGWDSGYGLWLFETPHWKLAGFTVADSKKGIVLDHSPHVTIDGVSVTTSRRRGCTSAAPPRTG